MAKTKTAYECISCGYESSRWYGKCPACDSWNTMEEKIKQEPSAPKQTKQRSGSGSAARKLSEIDAKAHLFTATQIDELDRVLGGGIVKGSLLLFGGEPGVGKSTLLLQALSNLSKKGYKTLYITGEESARQIKMRAERLFSEESEMLVLAENAMDNIEQKLHEIEPDYVVVDSIQTMYRPDMASSPGTVSQVRESAALFMRYAKEKECSVLLVGHVTKEGAIAGPRVLEHMVDVVLYFEGDHQREYRLLRAVKNRFGSIRELGIFEMTQQGMVALENPSETLLSQRAKDASGSVVFCGIEGSRPMLMDVQALATQSYLSSPRRTVNGMDYNRAILLIAVLEKRAGLRLFNQDIYVNVAGGLSLNEPAADLAVCLALASSLADKAAPSSLAAMGEVGLAGEIRSIPNLERRLFECRRLGFSDVICPKDGKVKKIDGLNCHFVSNIRQALALLHTLS